MYVGESKDGVLVTVEGRVNELAGDPRLVKSTAGNLLMLVLSLDRGLMRMMMY